MQRPESSRYVTVCRMECTYTRRACAVRLWRTAECLDSVVELESLITSPGSIRLRDA